MSLTLDQKVAKFTSIMKNAGYLNMNHYTIKSLLEIPDIQEFFDWFLLNVNEGWMITREQMFRFKDKMAKGQVIWDLNRLVATKKIIEENDNFQYHEIIKQNEQMEKELELLTQQFEMRQKQQQMINQKLECLKSTQCQLESTGAKLEKKINYKKKLLNTINQNVNKSLIEFQVKVESEEKFNQKISTDLNEIEMSMDNYIHRERLFMSAIEENMFIEFDYNYLGIPNRFQTIENILLDKLNHKVAREMENEHRMNLKYDNIEKVIKLMHGKYPELMASWFKSKVAAKVDHCFLNEMKTIIERKNEFFEFTQEQLNQNSQYRQMIESRINQNYSNATNLKKQLDITGENIVKIVSAVANLKTEKLVQYDMDKKQIDLHLFFNKQEKLLRLLKSQNSRLKLVDHLESFKLVELQSYQRLMEDLISSKSMFFSGFVSKCNSSVLASSSFYSNSNVTNVNTNNENNNSFFSTSFSASMANLLSSTAFQVSSPTKFNQTALFSLKNGNKMSNSMSLGTFQSNKASDSQELVHILNKFLILVLTRLQVDENTQKLIKLKHNVSINFGENLETFSCLYEAVNESLSLINAVNIRPSFQNLYNAIQEGIGYLYEKDQAISNNAMQYSMHKYDLSEIKIKTSKFLEQPLSTLKKEREDIEFQFGKLYKSINAFKSLLSSNKLERLKRELFVIFFINPQNIHNLVDMLNSIWAALF